MCRVGQCEVRILAVTFLGTGKYRLLKLSIACKENTVPMKTTMSW